MPSLASPRRSLRRTCNIPRHGDVYERVSVHQGSIVAVGGGEVIEVKLLVLQSWMDASKPAESDDFIRREHALLRLLAAVGPSALAGIGIGPTSSSSSESSAGAAVSSGALSDSTVDAVSQMQESAYPGRRCPRAQT